MDIMSENINVCEIFKSLQGESTFAGLPCSFIRLAGCNLNCKYCDTLYAQNINNGTKMTIADILMAIGDFPRLVEITGGEPLLQNTVQKLIDKLIENNKKVLIETNGSILINNLHEETTVILDCKCPSSGEQSQMLFENFKYLKINDEVKFVIADKTDYEYALNIVQQYNLCEITEKILFSPIYRKDYEVAQKLASWITRDEIQVRLNLQIHKIIWDPSERCR